MSRPLDPYDWVESWAWPIIEREPMPGCADLVLLRLAAHANGSAVARPSSATLGKQVGRSGRCVREALDTLVALGHIEPAEPRRPGSVTRWRLLATSRDAREVETSPDSPTWRQPGGDLAVTSRTVRDEGEGEGEDSLCSPVVARDAAEDKQHLRRKTKNELLSVDVCGILQRGIDGLTTDEPCKTPRPAAITAVLGEHPDIDPLAAQAVAIQTRSIAQSQNRAPNIVALFAQQLAKSRAALVDDAA